MTNIVCIICDDLGRGDVGWLGLRTRPSVTPRLDALAANSQVLSEFCSNGPLCSPTRAALLTGRYQQRCGITGVISAANHRDVGLAVETPTISAALKDAGYATALFGKWHLGYDVKYGPTRFGFDRFRGFVSGNVDYVSKIDQAGYADWREGEEQITETDYLTECITDHACKWIREQTGPFFCLIAHGAPHYPYQVPGDPAGRSVGNVGELRGVGYKNQDAYDAMLRSLDEQVGRVADLLDQQGLADDTLFIFTSDHGCPKDMGDNGPVRGHKGTLYEGGIRVPTFVRWPGQLEAGERTDLCTTVDLTATMAAAAAARVPQMDGESLLGDLPDRILCWEYSSRRAARQGSWKWVDDGEGPELFDLADDPAEQLDRLAREPDLAQRLADAWNAWKADVGDLQLT